MLIRFCPKIEHSKFAMYFPPIILAANICEAVMRDFQVFSWGLTEGGYVDNLWTISGPWNVMNGIAGLINVAATVTITDVTVNNTVVNGTQALGGIIGGESNSKAIVKYKNWTVTGCEFYVDGVKTEAIDGFDYADRKTLSATPGVYFGFIAGTLTEITD